MIRPKQFLADVVVVMLLLAPVASWAGRPLDTEDTGTVDPGKVELEVSGDYAKNPEDTTGSFKGVLNVGLLKGLEARIESSFLFLDPDGGSHENGVGDSLIGVKHRLLDETQRLPALLGSLTLRLPTGDEDRGLGAAEVDVGLLAVASKGFGPLTLTWNGGYTFVNRNRGLDFWTLNGSVEYRVTPAWSVVGEVASSIAARKEGVDTVVLRAGSVYAIHERIKLDGAVGVGLTRESPDVVLTLGITIALR